MKLLPHNEKAVNEIMKDFKNGKQCVIYTSGVGTGKSFVFLGVLERLRKMGMKGKVVYVIPKYAVRDNIVLYDDFSDNGDCVEFATYNTFKDHAHGMRALRGADFVLIDECHHVISDLYGTTLMQCVRELGVRTLGITATPEIDNGKDNVIRFFDAHVEGLTNFEAIREGLMPEIIYHICEPEKNIDKLNKDGNSENSYKLWYDNANDVLLPVLKKYRRNKWICFCSNIHEMLHYKRVIQLMFPNYEIVVLRSDLNNLSDVMDVILNNDHVVIMSVNILLEGVHLPEIDGIVLFRNVTSITAFQQMIGRICAIGKPVSPVVLDCSKSASKFLAMLMKEDDDVIEHGGGGGGYVKKPVVRVGLGSEDVFDIKTLLRYLDSPKAVLQENIEKMLDDFKERGGSLYRSYVELRQHKTDYQKFSASCWLFDLKPDTAAKHIYKIAE